MSKIRLVNEQVPIVVACRWAGMDIPEGWDNRKTRCPFGEIAHEDSGREAAWRIYEDTNTAFCFACGRAFAPVSLMAEIWDCTKAEAAEKMAVMAGIVEPTWREQWAALHEPRPVDRTSLAEALKQFCLRVRGPSWEYDQFEPYFSGPLADCLGVLISVTTDREAAEWLDGCKQIMESVIRGGENHEQLRRPA